MRTKKAETKPITNNNPATKAPAAAKRPRKTGDVGKARVGPVKPAAPHAQPAEGVTPRSFDEAEAEHAAGAFQQASEGFVGDR